MEYFNMQEYKLSYVQENIELAVYSIILFIVPFALGHPQWLVGVLVNSALILGALNIRNYKILPIIMLPSIGVLAAGLIFGQFTIYLVYMIPFIWTGNFALVYAFKKLNLGNKMNKWLVLVLGTALKAGFLFASAFVLVNLSVLPALFLTTMGLFQVYTAIAGGMIAFTLQGIKKKVC